MEKIKVILLKEWAEVFKNRTVLYTIMLMPLLFTAIPLGILYSMRGQEGLTDLSADVPKQFSGFCPEELSGGECFQVYLVSQFMLMFMFLPLTIPTTIAAFTIVGEKKNRTLEPLLATPITTVELLTGKSLASFIPAVAATFFAFGLYALGAWLLIPNPSLFKAIMDTRWLASIFLVGPLMALIAISVTMIVSSRVSDPRTAEQLAMVVIIPVLGLFFAQIAGVFVINLRFVLISAVVLAFIAGLLVYLTVRLFQRETILTRWK